MTTPLDPRAIAATTRSLLGVPAVVGFEGAFLDHLERLLRDRGLSPQRRAGLLAVVGPRPWTVTAHSDRHGLVVTRPGRAVYALDWWREESGSNARPIPGARLCDRFADEPVVAYDPITGVIVGRGTVEHSAACGAARGASIGVAGLDDVPGGTPVAYALECSEDAGVLAGQIDNTVSVALLLGLIAAGFDGTALFTAGEEAGTSWEALRAWAAERDRAGPFVVLDTSPFPTDEVARAGAVVLRRRDAEGEFAGGLVDSLVHVAADLAVPVVLKDERIERENAERIAKGQRPQGLGRTELGRLVAATAGRVNGATVQIPTFGYHTNHESTTLDALGNVAALVAALTEVRTGR